MGLTRVHFTVHCDNYSVVATLSKGTGDTTTNLSTLHGLRGNTFDIVQVASAQAVQY